MKKIRIDFCDFLPNFSKTNNYLFKLLSERFDVELCDRPDFLIYSCYGHAHRLYSGVRIFFSGESDLPDFSTCDYSMASVKHDDPRHLHLPCYIHYGLYADTANPQDAVKKNDDFAQLIAAKKKFCSFIISGYNPKKNGNRVDFFQKLSKYKKVDSGGRKFNNIGGPVPGGLLGKNEFLRQYKFNIAYENRIFPGYTTEKIFGPMVARCVPIYWGDPTINEQFNPCSFLNRADFSNDEALIEKIIELDNDDAKYLEYLRQPYFHNDVPNQYFNRERVLDFWEGIISKKIIPIAQARRNSFFFGRLLGRWQLAKRHHWHDFDLPGW